MPLNSWTVGPVGSVSATGGNTGPTGTHSFGVLNSNTFVATCVNVGPTGSAPITVGNTGKSGTTATVSVVCTGSLGSGDLSSYVNCYGTQTLYTSNAVSVPQYGNFDVEIRERK